MKHTITIEGNSPEELYANLKKMAAVFESPAPALSAVPPSQNNPPVFTPTTYAPPAAQNFAPPTNAASIASASPVMNGAPAAPPAYTLDDLARAGAVLAQSGKMQEAQELLTRYNIASLDQLKPEQYGAFATELRALGAPV